MSVVDWDNIEEYLVKKQDGINFTLKLSTDGKHIALTQKPPYDGEVEKSESGFDKQLKVRMKATIVGDKAFESYMTKYILDLDGEREAEGMRARNVVCAITC